MTAMFILLLGIALGWFAHRRKVRGAIKVAVRDSLIMDGFNAYRDINGELHRDDPRRVTLEVVAK